MIEKNLIEKKLRRIEEFIRELDQAEVDSLDQFRDDIVTKRFIERNIELAIEQMTDICKHLVSGLDLKEPESYRECFDTIAKENIITEKNVETFRSMIGFRNMLIHIYDNVDDSISYDIYKHRLGDFTEFVREIRQYIQKS